MMYPYMTLSDETEIVHSQIVEKNGIDTLLVHFERPTDDGFNSARCELPSYHWLYNEGFSENEISFFTRLLESNAHLLYLYARNGGVQIA